MKITLSREGVCANPKHLFVPRGAHYAKKRWVLMTPVRRGETSSGSTRYFVEVQRPGDEAVYFMDAVTGAIFPGVGELALSSDRLRLLSITEPSTEYADELVALKPSEYGGSVDE